MAELRDCPSRKPQVPHGTATKKLLTVMNDVSLSEGALSSCSRPGWSRRGGSKVGRCSRRLRRGGGGSRISRRRLAFVLVLFSAVVSVLLLVQPTSAKPAGASASGTGDAELVDTSKLSQELKDAFGVRAGEGGKEKEKNDRDSVAALEDHVSSSGGEGNVAGGNKARNQNATGTLEQRTGKTRKDTEEMRKNLETLRVDLVKNSSRTSNVVEDRLSRLREKLENRLDGQGDFVGRGPNVGNLRGRESDVKRRKDVKIELEELEKAIAEGQSEQKKAIDALNKMEEKMVDIVSEVNGTVRDVGSKEGLLRKKEAEIDSLKQQVEQNILLDKVAAVVQKEGAKINYDTGDITT